MEFIRYEVNDPVAVITLDRPEVLNAFHDAMLGELREAIDTAAADRAVVGIVITGNGRGFCAGLDAAQLARTTEGGSSGRPPVPDDEMPGLFGYLTDIPKPIIAAVNGVTAGGGFLLAAKCDLRFASTAAAFTTIFTKRGLIAEHGLTWFLPRQIGTGAALDLMWSSRKIDADEALRLGLVQQVVAPGRAARHGAGLRRRPRRQRGPARAGRHQAPRLRPRRDRPARRPARRRRGDVGRRRPTRTPRRGRCRCSSGGPRSSSDWGSECRSWSRPTTRRSSRRPRRCRPVT